jgi:gamma-glutamylcyclotransferase
MKKRKNDSALVFAYGSNMNSRQMATRCPGARIIDVATLPDHRLLFTGRSARWGGGVATIEPARRSRVVGVIWLVSAENLARLDEFEGYPYVYDRAQVLVDRAGGAASLWCHAYLKAEAHEKTPPSPLYLRTILDGFEDVGAVAPLNLRRLYSKVAHGLAA